MKNLKSKEIKTFIPAKDFEISKNFYQDVGFTKGYDADGLAYFFHDDCSFLLQDFYEPAHANNFMMHLLVEDVRSWHAKFLASNISEKYAVNISEIVSQPWGMLDFTLSDPSNVNWRFAQNV